MTSRTAAASSCGSASISATSSETARIFTAIASTSRRGSRLSPSRDQALVVNPNLAWAWHISGFAKALAGQPEVAVERATHAMRLSPQDPQFFAMRAVVALDHYLAGRYEAAYLWAEAALREKSNFLIAAGTAAASAALTGRLDDATRAMDRLRQLNPDLRVSTLGDWLAFQPPEDAAACADGLRRSGLPE